MPNHFNEWIHMLHRFFAIFGGTWLMFMAWQLRINSPLSGIRHVGTAILILIPSEVLVGIVNALYRIPVPVSALHTAIAATLVGLIAYALSESALLSNESESASTEQITARPARTGVAARIRSHSQTVRLSALLSPSAPLFSSSCCGCFISKRAVALRQKWI